MPLLILPNAYGDAATNMAIDASLLESLPSGLAVFRHYAWLEPAMTFGYTQRYSDIRPLAPEEITLCRRLTGGGLVDHRNDWTYALVLQTELAAAHAPAHSLYGTLHKAIQTALQAQGVDSQLAPCPKVCGEPVPPPADQCFVQPVADYVISPQGRKIAGAALKRTRKGLLVQGSINRAALPEALDYNRFKPSAGRHRVVSTRHPVGSSEDLRSIFDSKRIQDAPALRAARMAGTRKALHPRR